jgi:hypothetical protein
MKGMNRRRAGTLLGLLALAALALAGCSPTAPVTSPGKPSGSLTIPTPATDSVGATTLPNPSDWPDQDTPISQASVQLQMAWDPYGVTIIPSRHIFASIPRVPTLLNKTNGALTEDQVQEMGVALYRSSALWGWADQHDQLRLQVFLSNAGFVNTPAGNAEAKGEPVADPPCALYPVKLAVIAVDPAVVSFEEGVGYSVHASYALVEDYGGSITQACDQTAETPRGTQITWRGPSVNIETGTVRSDPLLGLTWFGESDRYCPYVPIQLPSPFGTPPPASSSPASSEPAACRLFAWS